MMIDSPSIELLQQTVPDVLVEILRNEIIRGNFKPGERLRLRDLADRYKVSTMPVREALQLLQIEGLVSGEARKGMTVTELTAAELEDIYDMRASLEAMATRVAVSKITAETLSAMSDVQFQLEANDQQKDVVKVVELNAQFHKLLYAASQRPHLCSNIEMLRRRISHYFNAYMSNLGAYAMQEHHAIIEACQNGNATLAAEIVYQHVTRAGKALRETVGK
ncbi:MAG: GntR family transcriptional regulator [Anaerolineae bacterium]|nr:GntR family transcriptional regulator [Anaerolineae bacterium]